MAAPDFKTRFQEVIKLLDYGYANYTTQSGLPKGEQVGKVMVYKGMCDYIDAVIEQDKTFLIQKDNQESLEHEIQLISSINAPFQSGTKVGEIIYKIGDTEVGRSNLITASGADKINMETMLLRLFHKWCP